MVSSYVREGSWQQYLVMFALFEIGRVMGCCVTQIHSWRDGNGSALLVMIISFSWFASYMRRRGRERGGGRREKGRMMEGRGEKGRVLSCILGAAHCKAPGITK